jgi:hypothetical protein
MPGHSDKPSNAAVDFKVFLCNPRGMYLAQDDNGLFFSNDRSAAIILNYKADNVADQLESLRQTHGIQLTADPVPVGEIYETCDRCKELFMPWMTFFDGKHFLCNDCRKLAARASARRA